MHTSILDFPVLIFAFVVAAALPSSNTMKVFVRCCIIACAICVLHCLAIARHVVKKIYRVIASKLGMLPPVPLTVRTPDEVFDAIPDYNFKPNYTLVGEFRLHYVDEGPKTSQEVIVCLHGEPTWSYLYRKMIPIFVHKGYRVVCPDFLGFGRSDKITDPDHYSHDLHCHSLVHLMEELDLKNITLVVQDWGGLTGLSALPDFESRVSRLVIMNTGLPPSGGKYTTFRTQLNFLAWRSFANFLQEDLPIEAVMQQSCKGIAPGVAQAYAAPFHTRLAKAGSAKWPLMVPIFPQMEAAKGTKRGRAFLRTWHRPCLVMFSDKCPVTRGMDSFFLELIPAMHNPEKGRHLTVKGAGHFLQEDKGEEVARNICKFLQDIQP